MSSVSRFHPRGACITVHNVGAGGMLSGHRFPPHVSLHLTVPLLVDSCAVWLRKGKLLIFHNIVLSSKCTGTRGLVASGWGHFPITWDTTLDVSAA